MGGGKQGSAKLKKGAVGNAIANAQKKAAAQSKTTTERVLNESGHGALSVLERKNLDDFLETAAMAQTDFTALRGTPALYKDESALLTKRTHDDELAAEVDVPIPRRPPWSTSDTKETLEQRENEAFLAWRRQLAHLEDELRRTMTPFERNLNFWRQLWRVIERSDVLVHILDCRDPLFFRSADLERYVQEVAQRQQRAKRTILLFNKSDFLPAELVTRWKRFFAAKGVTVWFFSALRELKKVVDSEDQIAHAVSTAPHGVFEGMSDEVLDTDALKGILRRVLGELEESSASANAAGGAADAAPRTHKYTTVGFVGFPNVGKSSVINALFGVKKTSMSRTPGKTKHFQTLVMDDGVTLCDCPGLVFPSVVAQKSTLVTNNTAPLDFLRGDYLTAVREILDRATLRRTLDFYGCLVADPDAQDAPRLIPKCPHGLDPARHALQLIAAKRKKVIRLGQPDETWAARQLVKDFQSGALCCCRAPPDGEDAGDMYRATIHDVVEPVKKAAEDVAELGPTEVRPRRQFEEEVDVDLHEGFGMRGGSAMEVKVSKRAMRKAQKADARGKRMLS